MLVCNSFYTKSSSPFVGLKPHPENIAMFFFKYLQKEVLNLTLQGHVGDSGNANLFNRPGKLDLFWHRSPPADRTRTDKADIFKT